MLLTAIETSSQFFYVFTKEHSIFLKYSIRDFFISSPFIYASRMKLFTVIA